MNDRALLEVSVWRGKAEGRLHVFEVPRRDNQTVLDVVTHIQRHLDPTLSYRYSCRVGMCGTCAMTVNGVPRWTCRTHVSKVAKKGRLEIRPLRNFPVIKDLAVDMGAFFDKWQAAHGRFEPEEPDSTVIANVDPQSAARRAADAGIECIGCGVCQSACDMVAADPVYLGPAPLNRAWTALNDVRDGDRPGHLAAVSGEGGVHACHSQGNCARHCPNGLNPTASIAGLKRAVLVAALKGTW